MGVDPVVLPDFALSRLAEAGIANPMLNGPWPAGELNAVLLRLSTFGHGVPMALRIRPRAIPGHYKNAAKLRKNYRENLKFSNLK